MPRTNLSKVYMIQGASGPVEAQRPTNDELRTLNALPRMERISKAMELAAAGCTIDMAVDVNAGSYWKVTEQRRRYGYTWVPAAHMPNILIAPGLWMPSEDDDAGMSYNAAEPPMGAILIPRTEQDDPNYGPPTPIVVPPPPPDGQAVFGPPIEYGEFAGAYSVDPDNSVPPGSHATKDGVEYVYVVLARGFTGKLALWMPIGGN